MTPRLETKTTGKSQSLGSRLDMYTSTQLTVIVIVLKNNLHIHMKFK